MQDRRETLNAWFAHVADLESPVDIRSGVELLGAITDLRAGLAEVADGLRHEIGALMEGPTVVLDGIGVVTRRRDTDRKTWDRDGLLRTVLDSRLVDAATGEIADESQLDKVLKVWHLGAPRTGVLRERGIDADEYCQVERREGYTIRVLS